MKLEEAIQKISHKDWAVRSKAFETITNAGEVALPKLIEVLLENDSYRQEIAIAWIWEIHRQLSVAHPDLVPALVDAIRRNEDDNPLVVMDGFGLLADLNDLSAFDDLVIFLASKNEDMRELAVDALARLKDKRAIKRLQAILDDPEPIVRYRALWAIGYIDRLEGVKILGDNLNNTLTDRRGIMMSEVAQQELIRIGTPEALEAIEVWKRNQST